jgi:hypothetical protein
MTQKLSHAIPPCSPQSSWADLSTTPGSQDLIMSANHNVRLKTKLLVETHVLEFPMTESLHSVTKCGCNSLVLIGCIPLSPIHYDYWIHSKSNEIIWRPHWLHPTKSYSLWLVNSLKIQWNHFTYKDTFSCRGVWYAIVSLNCSSILSSFLKCSFNKPHNFSSCIIECPIYS